MRRLASCSTPERSPQGEHQIARHPTLPPGEVDCSAVWPPVWRSASAPPGFLPPTGSHSILTTRRRSARSSSTTLTLGLWKRGKIKRTHRAGDLHCRQARSTTRRRVSSTVRWIRCHQRPLRCTIEGREQELILVPPSIRITIRLADRCHHFGRVVRHSPPRPGSTIPCPELRSFRRTDDHLMDMRSSTS